MPQKGTRQGLSSSSNFCYRSRKNGETTLSVPAHSVAVELIIHLPSLCVKALWCGVLSNLRAIGEQSFTLLK